MKFEGTTVWGFANAVWGARLPMCKNFAEAKAKSDSKVIYDEEAKDIVFVIGEDDMRVCKKLINADSKGCGQPNSKFLRMIHVQVAVTAPLYLFKELDTYKIATVTNSTSTMHKLASTPITKDCFEMDDFENMDTNGSANCHGCWDLVLFACEGLRQKFNEFKDKRYWKELIRLLPESWLQTRMFDCNYETLRNIYAWRHNHKLSEWHKFCEWIETLPYAKEFIC